MDVLGGIIGGLIVAAFVWWKDETIQENSQSFDIAFSSELAKVVVLRQVEFGEKYIELIIKFLDYVLLNGEDEKTFLDYSNKLSVLHKKYLIWIDDEADLFLSRLESDIRTTGIRIRQIERKVYGEENEKKRSIMIDDIYLIVNNILGINDENVGEDYHYEAIVRNIKSMIGIEKVIKNRGEF